MAWISLDAGDNDPARFWSYVTLALRRARPGVGDTPLAVRPSHQPAPAEAMQTRLLNELATLGTEAALVLDDCHVIDTAAIHQRLSFFIEHLPPRLHLFLATRADPPCRWRAGRHVALCSSYARTTRASVARRRSGS